MDRVELRNSRLGRRQFVSHLKKMERSRLTVARRKRSSLWFGLGTLGIVGWSVALPSVLGALLGVWLDRHVPAQHSWTLALLVAGVCIGAFVAWSWVSREEREMKREVGDDSGRATKQNKEKRDV